MWNPFSKNTGAQNTTPKMGMLQAIAMKKLAKMSPQERNKMIQDAKKPENQEKIMAAIEQMKKMGMASDEQIAQAKEMLGM